MATLSPSLSTESRVIRICDRIMEFLLYLVYFLIPIFFIILTRDQFELPKLALFRMLTCLMLATWGIRLLASREWRFQATPLALPLLAWILLQLLTAVVSVSGYVSYRGEYENFRGLLTVLNYPILFYLLVHFLRTRQQINRLFFVTLLAGLVITAYGIAQFFGLDFIAWNPTSIAPGRYFSTLGNPNFLAAYLAMVLPWTIVFFIETQSTFRRVLLFVSFVVMFFALLGTWSRGGFLGLIAALAVLAGFGLWRGFTWLRQQPVAAAALRQSLPGFRIWLALLGLALATLITLSLTFGRHHMLRMADTILHFPAAVKVSRLHIWGPALGMIRDYPVLGTGLDTFKTVFPRYATPAFAAIDGANVSSRTAHNEILQVLATQGVVGLAVVIWLTVAMAWWWWRAYRRPGASGRDRLLLVGVLATWTAYSVQNLFSFGVVSIDSLYWLLPAVVVLLLKTPDEQAQSALPQAPAAKPGRVWQVLQTFQMPLALLVVAAALTGVWMNYRAALADYAYNLGTIYRMQNNLNYCLRAFATASRLVPTEVKYIVYEGLAYEEMVRTVPPDRQLPLIQQALALYRRGVEMNPTNAYYLGNLGRAYSLAAAVDPQNQDYFNQAVRYFREAVHYAPVTVLFYQNLGMTYLVHGELEKFKEVAKQLAGFDPKEAAGLVFSGANQLYNQNRPDMALPLYQLALEYKPDYAEAHFNLGVAYARTGRILEALAEWRRVLELRPDFTPAQEMLKRYAAPGSAAPSQSILNP
ncbi:MAG: O-antigen ligase family protein [candidate division FCPU426 bacterium]